MLGDLRRVHAVNLLGDGEGLPAYDSPARIISQYPLRLMRRTWVGRVKASMSQKIPSTANVNV